MRVVVQRVRRASVEVDGRIRAEIARGLLALVAFRPGDGTDEIEWMAGKLTGLRIFADEEGRMNRSVGDVDGELLVVSQFTLYGDVSRGRRPSFIGAERADAALALYEQFLAACGGGGIATAGGVFGADMAVELVNDGPVTLVIDR